VRAFLSALLIAGLAAAVSAQQDGGTGLPATAAAATSAAMDLDEARAMQEMLRGSAGRPRRWTRKPHLVVVRAVLAFTDRNQTRFEATATRLTEEEAAALAGDLTAGLETLTGGAFQGFASVRVEDARAGRSVSVVRPGDIVAGRFRGVREHLDAVGYGGRTARPDGTITSGVVMLDEDYDRDGPHRRLLRTHELGHALGYNHVESQRSVMNATIGAEPTDFDRRVARIAFRHLSGASPVRVLADGQ
jgi:hypothetical protein